MWFRTSSAVVAGSTSAGSGSHGRIRLACGGSLAPVRVVPEAHAVSIQSAAKVAIHRPLDDAIDPAVDVAIHHANLRLALLIALAGLLAAPALGQHVRHLIRRGLRALRGTAPGGHPPAEQAAHRECER